MHDHLGVSNAEAKGSSPRVRRAQPAHHPKPDERVSAGDRVDVGEAGAKYSAVRTAARGRGGASYGTTT
jgi:hypothetical protein